MSRALPLALAGGGLAAGAAALLGWREAGRTTARVSGAVVSGGSVPLRLTTYWPFQTGLSVKEREMEGGTSAAAPPRYLHMKTPQLSTLEQHLSDPAAHPYVSLAGDLTIWPYGQRLVIPSLGDGVVARVVDTGSHFHGANKVFRVVGREPIDVCVDSSRSKKNLKISSNDEAAVVAGDNFEAGKNIAAEKLPTVAGESAAFTDVDRASLACAVDLCCGRAGLAEMQACAWALRNRAALAGEPLAAALDRDFGPAGLWLPPSEDSRLVAAAVLRRPASDDPTGGAVDFWCPRQHRACRAAGDAWRAAVESDDPVAASELEPYGNYVSEDEARARFSADGLVVVGVVGDLELLGAA